MILPLSKDSMVPLQVKETKMNPEQYLLSQLPGEGAEGSKINESDYVKLRELCKSYNDYYTKHNRQRYHPYPSRSDPNNPQNCDPNIPQPEDSPYLTPSMPVKKYYPLINPYICKVDNPGALCGEKSKQIIKDDCSTDTIIVETIDLVLGFIRNYETELKQEAAKTQVFEGLRMERLAAARAVTKLIALLEKADLHK